MTVNAKKDPLGYRMALCGVNQLAVAKTAGVQPPVVSNVLSGQRKSARIVEVIAGLINRSPQWVLEEIEIRAKRRERREQAIAEIESQEELA